MSILKRSTGILFSLSLLVAMPAISQQCIPIDQLVDDYVESEYLLKAGNLKIFAEQTRAEVPERLLAATAISASQVGEALVAGADSAALLGLAVQSGLASQEDGIISFSLTPFLLRLAGNHELWTDQAKYTEEGNKKLRKFSFSGSFGGKGEALDYDGDGVVEEAKEAASPTDIIVWEGRFRLTRSRDFREEYNWSEIQSINHDPLGNLAGYLAASKARIISVVGINVACLTRSDFNAKMEQNPDLLSTLDADFRASVASLDESLAKSLEAIQRPVWMLAIGGIERDEAFGRDSHYVEVRGTIPLGLGRDLSLNAGWKEIKEFRDLPDPTTWTIGAKWTQQIFQGLLGEKGIEANFSGLLENYDDVPDVKHSSIAKLQMSFDFPISDGVKMPVSVMWANHSDLISDDHETVGHIGFKFDMSKILKAPIPGAN